MTEEAQLHFERAAECVEDSRILLDNKRPAAAVARAYYAMFHAATAALAAKDIKRSSHRGVLSAFGQHLVKTGLINKKFHLYLREAFELRQQTDYDPIVDVKIKQAKEILKQAVDFVDACKKFCK
ncbi:MAG: HEPN domain-containing protein [Phycisphaerales bacterium]|jgi:uncharacterized protein (UPF0332 family)